jgi:hypothetical protein
VGPVTAKPMQLACTRLPVAELPMMATPLPSFPAMTFLHPAVVPPMVLPGAPSMTTPSDPLLTPPAPDTSVPMKLPCSRFPVAPLPWMRTPAEPLPEMTLRSATVAPPIVLLAFPSMSTPSPTFGDSTVPVASSPMKLPLITVPPPLIWIPLPLNRLMTRFCTVQPLAATLSPLAAAPALVPFSSMRVASRLGPAAPLIRRGLVTAGRPLVEPTAMLGTPPPRLKLTISAAVVELACSIAARKVHWPLPILQTPSSTAASPVSPREVTVNVTACAAGSHAPSTSQSASAPTEPLPLMRDGGDSEGSGIRESILCADLRRL